jgi:hypothetical protein
MPITNGVNRTSVRYESTRLKIVESLRTAWDIRAYHALTSSHNDHAKFLYQRRTRKARSVFQRLALPTSVSIFIGIISR